VAIPWLHHGYSMFAFYHEPEHAHAHWDIMITSTLVAVSGIVGAWLIYYKKVISAEVLGAKFRALYKLSFNKFYFDEIYNAVIIKPVLAFATFLWNFDSYVIDGIVNGVGRLTLLLSDIQQWIDVHIVDGIVNGFGYTIWGIGAVIRQFQTGRVQFYGFVIVFGIVLMLVIKVV